MANATFQHTPTILVQFDAVPTRARHCISSQPGVAVWGGHALGDVVAGQHSGYHYDSLQDTPNIDKGLDGDMIINYLFFVRHLDLGASSVVQPWGNGLHGMQLGRTSSEFIVR